MAPKLLSNLKHSGIIHCIVTTKPSNLSKSEIKDAAKALGASYLNPLDPDQKDVELAVGSAYAIGKLHDLSGKAASEFRASMRKRSNKNYDAELVEPDDVKNGDSGVEIYNFSQEDTSSKPENTEQGGEKFMSTDEEDPFDEEVEDSFEFDPNLGPSDAKDQFENKGVTWKHN